MRMRRKSNLDLRLGDVGDYLLHIETREFYRKAEEDRFRFFDFSEVFGNNRPIWLDVGCGKGSFALETAARNPGVNVIAVEKISNVIIEGCENALKSKPINCRFLNCAAENLKYYIRPKTTERIFLNFSCPYPKKTYENRRLTYFRYLSLFADLLKSGGEIHLKTDDRHFFEYSLSSLSQNGFLLKSVSLDLCADDDNIMTEYERMFREKGLTIYKLVAYIK